MNTTQLGKSYPNRFEGIGNFDGQFHITTDRNVTPEVHAPRKCPIHMHDEIKSELENMESLGVIKRVTQPTDWVSSIVYSRKSSGQLRISLNLTDLNKAVKRPHYKTPILNEVITAADRTAKRRSGTWQIKTRSVPQRTIEALNNRIHQICQIKRYRRGQSSSALHAQDADPGWKIFQIVEKCLHCEFRHMDGVQPWKVDFLLPDVRNLWHSLCSNFYSRRGHQRIYVVRTGAFRQQHLSGPKISQLQS